MDLKPLTTLCFYFLDKDEALCCIENEDLRDFHRTCWELEFEPVAQKLVKTLLNGQ